jgi:hypothetical protein
MGGGNQKGEKEKERERERKDRGRSVFLKTATQQQRRLSKQNEKNGVL